MDLTRDHKATQAGTGGGGRRTFGFWRVAAIFVTMGIVALLLGAEPLHLRAQGLAPSPWRTVAVAITGPLATASDAVYLDRPWEWATGYVEYEEADADIASGLPGAPGGGPPGTSFVTTTTTTTAAAASTTTTTIHVTSSTTTTTAPRPVFTAEDPLRVLVVGDSLVVMMGYGLMRQAEANPAMRVEAVTKVSSGLSRPDFYNWPQVLAETIAEYHPDVTVILFGGNDKQTIRTQGKALETFTDDWFSEYYRRVWGFLDVISNAGGEAIWVGLPIMRSDKFAETARTLNSMYQAACDNHRNATYVDGYSLFEDQQGKYNAYLVDSAGERELMRAEDGIHFTSAGGDRQAEAVMQVLLEQVELRP